ncbi:related to serine/threonine-protein kinase [Rhynchosporium graminicola]|uniref:Serine/threonine-protein kinase ATG1 n=2 Tax=Rhynchosporium TaxID=38037 RepID=A0A1E1MCP9_RHYSE|nr:related to serine/threonine-protein kinase [Rhynchosporium commune]CZT46881.1 related to serine/threonine-protein kinase [Rhynchosporium secalis]
MSSISQSIKNLIRHGKGGRASQQPHDDPTTHVSPVNVHNSRHQEHAPPQHPNNHYANSDPTMNQQHNLPHAGGEAYSTADLDNRNRGAQAGNVAAHSAEQKQKKGKVDHEELARIVAEENESKGKLPKYPDLQRWQLIEKMGDGAFSNVYRARDLEGQVGEVAIKVVRKFEMNSGQRANILKEVQIMRQLDHPNIVKLVDFSESKQYYYIVLELAPGGELFHQIVRLTYFSEDLSRHVITQVAQALEYLHEECGVVHRDIKPENLLFSPIPHMPTKNPKPKGPEDEDKVDEGEFVPGVGAGGIGTIKIADFGLSKIVWDNQTMTPCGTVGYTAPEIVKDERYSKSVDMWAMGCVLYTLLCGFPPFYDESIQVLTEKVARGQYTFLSPWWDDISKSAQDLVSHLLTVDPAKRYTIKEFLEHPWIKNTKEPTYAARDAPPLATPAVERQKQLGINPALLESPGVGRRQDFRSPGQVNLREVFDVSYAVHRQEEEGKRRKNFKPGYRNAAAMNGLNPIDDDEFDEEEEYQEDNGIPSKVPKARDADVHQVEQGMRNTNLNAAAAARAPPAQKGYGQHSAAVTAAAKQQVRARKGNFELSLDNSTLLGRRGKKGPSGLSQSTTADE